MRIIFGIVLFGFFGACNAKCLPMPLFTAEIEFEQCQGVKFDASLSKINWFPGEPQYMHLFWPVFMSMTPTICRQLNNA